MATIRTHDDLEAVRHANYIYNREDELRRSTGSIYGGESPTKALAMHMRSNSDTSEINFPFKVHENNIGEPRSPTGESFFAIVQRFEKNIQDERGVTRQFFQGSVTDGVRERIQNTLSASPTIEKKTPILRRKNSLRSNAFFRSKKNIDNYKEGDVDLDKIPVRKAFAYYDCQSLNVDYEEQIKNRLRYGDGLRRKNTKSGASAASTRVTAATIADKTQDGSNTSLDKLEEIPDYGDNKSNELVHSCPYFRNELGGEDDLDPQISLTRDNPAFQNPYNALDPKERKANAGKRRSTLDILLTAYDSARRGNLRTGTGVTILDSSKPESGSLYLGEGATTSDEEGKVVFEHADHGAYFYRNFFVGQEHLTYLGSDDRLGPVAISLKREKLDETTSLIRNDTDVTGTQYQYRIIARTAELTTLRGSILEEAVPSTSRHGTARALPAKDILEYATPELQLTQLKLAQPGIKVPEQLMKLDEQGMTNQYKVGILYCRLGQSTEEEMYNNQTSSPAFEEFLNLIGKKVRLKGFDGYRAQLDNRNDSTGEYSVYTKFHNREIMFHVSTLLPWTPNNRQQLLRKRHIGNDIVTIVFQEPGALPFTPKNIRSHFQHVFIVIRVFNPCTDNTYYRVAVSRSKDVPPFGPPIPAGPKFGKQKAFANFLLSKIINAENAAHKSEKFSAMATRTRHEYLKDLATNYVTATTLDTGGKSFSKFSLSSKKKEKVRPPISPELVVRGGLAWSVQVEDYRNSSMIECSMGISADTLVLIDSSSKETLFSVPCKAIIGWTSLSASIKVFYGSGDCLVLNIPQYESDDLPEIVRRLGAVTIGCQTQTLTLRRNLHGQLGFHVQYEGLVADVETGGYAWQAGLRQGCRLVEINGLIVATLSHEQMIEILRKPGSVTVVVVQPLPSGKPRKGVQQTNQQYWWSARSSTTTISSFGGSASSVGEEQDSRDYKGAPPRATPKTRPGAPWPGKLQEDTESSGSSVFAPVTNHKTSGSTSSNTTGSSTTLNEDHRSQATYGAAYAVSNVTPSQPDSGNGSMNSLNNRPRWRGIAPIEVDNANGSLGVTLKAPTSKGTLYVIASGPQSPTISSPRATDVPIFGSTSQRPERQKRAVVNEQGELISSEGEESSSRSGDPATTREENGNPAGPAGVNGAKRVPFKETSLGAVVTTTNTYVKKNYDEVSEASMTETMDKIEKAFGFKAPKTTDTPLKNYDYGQFERASSMRRSGRRSPRSSTEDLKMKESAADALSRSKPASVASNGATEGLGAGEGTENSALVIQHEIKNEHALALSAEELKVQLILEELQQAERDLGAQEARVQTVVEVKRDKGEVILESTQKPKEIDQRLAARNNLIEKIEMHRQAMGNDAVEGVKIYHAKSRSTPADVTKAPSQPYGGDRGSVRQKYAASQDDITGRVRQEREKFEQRKTQSTRDLGASSRHSTRRRRERPEHTPEKPSTAEAPVTPTRSVKPMVRSERKIKLSQSGPSSVPVDEKAQTLPRYNKPNRRHRYATKQPAESESSEEDTRRRERSRPDASRNPTSALSPEKTRKSSSLPRDGETPRSEVRRVSADERYRHGSHLRGARITKLKLSASEEPDSIVDQTSRLLHATEETSYGQSFTIAEDVLSSLTQASDLLQSQAGTSRDDRDREGRTRERGGSTRDRDRDRDRSGKDAKAEKMSKLKGHARGRSHGPHKFHIPVVPRRHSFDDRVFAHSSNKPQGSESSLTRESIGREAELEMKLAIVSNALMKEGEERQRVEADLRRAHRENRRLQEDLRTASGQLRKFTEWFFRNVDQNHT